MVLLEDVEEFVLTYQFPKFRGVFCRWYAQQHAVVVFHEVEEVYLSRVGEHGAVVVVFVAVYVII